MNGSYPNRRGLWCVAFRRLTIAGTVAVGCLLMGVVAKAAPPINEDSVKEDGDKDAVKDSGRDSDSPTATRWRRYGDKIKQEDLAGSVPEKRPVASVPVLAYVDITIRYDFKSQLAQDSQQVTATLTEIEIYSAVDRQVSWLYGGANAQLLDHLQGHFDLVEVEARKASTAFHTLLDGGSVMAGEGKDRNEALRDLQAKIEKNLESFRDRAGKERGRYDKVTRFGTRRDKLRIERRKHHNALGDRERTRSGGH